MQKTIKHESYTASIQIKYERGQDQLECIKWMAWEIKITRLREMGWIVQYSISWANLESRRQIPHIIFMCSLPSGFCIPVFILELVNVDKY